MTFKILLQNGTDSLLQQDGFFLVKQDYVAIGGFIVGAYWGIINRLV